MSLQGKNKKPFSYINKIVLNKYFQNKDFNKTSSHQSNFSNSTFENTSFIDAKFKFSALYGVKYKGCVITGSHFKKCNLENAIFEECVIRATVFEKCKLKGVSFINCYLELGQLKNYPNLSFINCKTDVYTREMFSPQLLDIVEELRTNIFIRRSMVLVIKNNKINLLALKKLVDHFTEERLLDLLPMLPNHIKNQFYTVSYIEKILSDLEDSSNI